MAINKWCQEAGEVAWATVYQPGNLASVVATAGQPFALRRVRVGQWSLVECPKLVDGDPNDFARSLHGCGISGLRHDCPPGPHTLLEFGQQDGLALGQ